jgi:hypothetical protein
MIKRTNTKVPACGRCGILSYKISIVSKINEILPVTGRYVNPSALRFLRLFDLKAEGSACLPCLPQAGAGRG